MSDSLQLLDCSLSHSSVRRILQARVLEWVAVSFSRGSSRLGDETQVFRIAGRFFATWATREAHMTPPHQFFKQPFVFSYISYTQEWINGFTYFALNSH